MENKKVTVIVPVYKVEKFLNECVESIVNQEYKNLEIILVDDGSPDNCPQMCDEWAKKDKRIKVVHKENGGVSSARNVGLAMATGDLITMLDSDDSLTLDFVKAVNDIRDHIDIAIVPIKTINLENEVLNLDEETFGKLIRNSEIDISSSCSKFYTKEIVKLVRYSEDVTVGEDKEFVVKCLLQSKKVQFINCPFYHYRDNPDSCMNNKGFKLITKLIDSTKKVFENIENYSCAENCKAMIKEEFSSNLYGAFRFYSNCSKEEKKIVKKQIKECLWILKLTKDKTKKMLYTIMKCFGIGFGLNSLNVLRKLKFVE